MEPINNEPQINIYNKFQSVTAPELPNYNQKRFYGTANLPQPAVMGFGYVTSAGAKDTAKVFLPDQWVVTKPSTGTYRITHNLVTDRYDINVTPVDTSMRVTVISNRTTTAFDVLIYNQAGTLTDTAFRFSVQMIP